MFPKNSMFCIRRTVNECSRQAHKFSSGLSKSDLFRQLPTYESVHSLKNLYPTSSLKITAVPQLPKSEGKFSGYIPIEKLTTNFCRSSGPGGQNVNKVNSKVILSFHLQSADWISESTRQKLALVHKNSISKDGIWVIRSDKTRTQTLNVADCIDKLRCYIAEVEQPPPEVNERTLEKKRLTVERAAAERLRRKRHSSMLKSMKNVDL